MSLSEADKKARRGGMGGTDVADLAEGRAFEVYRRKADGYEIEDNVALRRGRVLEAPTIELYRLETGAEVLPGGFIQHPKKPIFLSNLDGRSIRDGGERVLEVKTVSRHNLHQWGDGDDEIASRALLQTQWYMGITGLPMADVAALLGGELKVYTLKADPELFGLLTEMAERFWVDHVVPRSPPPPDSSEACGEWLASRFREVRGEAKQANAEAHGWAREYADVTAFIERAKERRDKAKNELKAAIGEAPGLVGDGWRISWALTKGRESTDWAAVAAEAGITKELIAKHTKRKDPYRTFRFNGGSENE